MAKQILRNCFVSINGTDCSSLIREVTVQMQAADVDITSFGAAAHSRLAGLRDDSFTMTAYQDFDASTGLHKVIQPLMLNASTFVVAVAPNGSTIGTANPYIYGTVCCLSYNPLAGAVGDASMTPLNFPTASGTFSIATS